MARLFRSKRQRERDERRERRRAFRKAENSIDDVKDRIRSMQKEADRQWEEARTALKEGQKAAANRLLTSYRASQILMTKLEQKRWVFEQYLTKMQAAQTDAEFAHALDAVNRVVDVNPDLVADVFEVSQDLLGEQVDADRFWSKLYEKEMDGAGDALQDHIPSLDELSAQLEAEAGVEIGSASTQAAADLKERIEKGKDRVSSLLDDDKQHK